MELDNQVQMGTQGPIKDNTHFTAMFLSNSFDNNRTLCVHVTESAGVGMFLLLRSTQLLLLRNNRTCMGLSLYLDIHGEVRTHFFRSYTDYHF